MVHASAIESPLQENLHLTAKVEVNKIYLLLSGNLVKNVSDLPGGESNPGLPRDRRGYLPLYYRGPLVSLKPFLLCLFSKEEATAMRMMSSGQLVRRSCVDAYRISRFLPSLVHVYLLCRFLYTLITSIFSSQKPLLRDERAASLPERRLRGASGPSIEPVRRHDVTARLRRLLPLRRRGMTLQFTGYYRDL